MANDRNGKDVLSGARVYVECDVTEVHGEVLHLNTVVPTTAYPNGTRINVLASQVEIMEREPEPEKLPLSGTGTEVVTDESGEEEEEDEDDEAETQAESKSDASPSSRKKKKK